MNPTAYADIYVVLEELEARIRAILGDRVVGIYLYGSLALGDFDAQRSDVDVIVVTDGEPGDDAFSALREMHIQLVERGPKWAAKVEAAYIPQEALNHAAPTAAKYPQIEKGKTLVWEPLDIGWAFQRDTLREHGVVIAGPEPRTFMDPTEPEDMRRAVAAIAGGWLEQARHDPAWLDWVRGREASAFVVLTLCRCLWTLEFGGVTSKFAAARWAQSTLGERWDALIERCATGPQDDEKITDGELEDTLALIAYVVERSGPRVD